MLNKKYLMLTPDEDGNPTTFLTKEDVLDILQNPEDHGEYVWLDALPDETNPQYWKEKYALLLEVKIVKPIAKKTVVKVVKWGLS